MPHSPRGENYWNRVEREREEFLAALQAAVPIIRAWHGEEAFDIYYEHSPEMKPIREALAKGKL